MNNILLSDEVCNLPLYEAKVFQEISGPALRPGGLHITKEALRLCPLKEGSLLLDLGCGLGESLSFFKQKKLIPVGLDLSLSFLKKNTGLLVQADAQAPPFKSDTFDAIFSECVFSLLPEKDKNLEKYHKILKDKGRIYISDIFNPNALADINKKSAACSCAQAAISVKKMIELLENTGFKILHSKDFSFYLKELAAKMIFKAGSVENFKELWLSEARGLADKRTEHKKQSAPKLIKKSLDFKRKKTLDFSDSRIKNKTSSTPCTESNLVYQLIIAEKT